MRWGAVIALVLLCSSASAEDPWKPLKQLFFPGPRAPVVEKPLPPVQETAPEAIERALLEAELQAAVKRAEEATERAEKAEAERAAAEARDAKSPVPPLPQPKPKVRTKAPIAPISLAPPPVQPQTPEQNDGRWLAPCWMVCGYVKGKSKAELDASEAEWRVSERQKAHGDCCILRTCRDAVAEDALKKMLARRRCT